MNFLDFIPEYIFEIIGAFAGFAACFVITLQIIKEYKSSVLPLIELTESMSRHLIEKNVICMDNDRKN